MAFHCPEATRTRLHTFNTSTSRQPARTRSASVSNKITDCLSLSFHLHAGLHRVKSFCTYLNIPSPTCQGRPGNAGLRLGDALRSGDVTKSEILTSHWKKKWNGTSRWDLWSKSRVRFQLKSSCFLLSLTGCEYYERVSVINY